MDKSLEAAADNIEHVMTSWDDCTPMDLARAAIAAYRDAEIERLAKEAKKWREAHKRAQDFNIQMVAKLAEAERDAERAASKGGRHAD